MQTLTPTYSNINNNIVHVFFKISPAMHPEIYVLDTTVCII